MKYLRHIIFILAVSFGVAGCQKDNISPESVFEININNSDNKFSAESAKIAKGITIIAAQESKANFRKAIVITINGDEVGKYKQTFDYKTGVSISQCGLSYKIISKEKEPTPAFFTSYEGSVEISDLDRKNKKVSGEYNFKLYSVPNDNKPYVIKGKFVNIIYE